MTEQPLSFLSGGQWLSGIIHQPKSHYSQVSTGILMVVGGPQTRVGSHRQFILLARFLAEQGYFVMRFDYHGMGDSEGEVDGFLNVSGDINMALDQFIKHCPSISDVSLWGLCDAASAILLFNRSYPRSEVKQMILLNPWVATQQLEAKTVLRHYYLSRLTDRQVWKKLIRFEFNIKQTVSDLFDTFKSLLFKPQNIEKQTDDQTPNEHNYVALMKESWQRFPGTSHVVLSGNDLVAAQFMQLVEDESEWADIIDDQRVIKTVVADANHTFSSKKWRHLVEQITLNEIRKI